MSGETCRGSERRELARNAALPLRVSGVIGDDWRVTPASAGITGGEWGGQPPHSPPSREVNRGHWRRPRGKGDFASPGTAWCFDLRVVVGIF